jgi:hypothetical protein
MQSHESKMQGRKITASKNAAAHIVGACFSAIRTILFRSVDGLVSENGG